MDWLTAPLIHNGSLSFLCWYVLATEGMPYGIYSARQTVSPVYREGLTAVCGGVCWRIRTTCPRIGGNAHFVGQGRYVLQKA